MPQNCQTTLTSQKSKTKIRRKPTQQRFLPDADDQLVLEDLIFEPFSKGIIKSEQAYNGLPLN